MSHLMFKVKVSIPNNEEEVIFLKHYIDMIYPCYEKFKAKILERYPLDDGMDIKLFWKGMNHNVSFKMLTATHFFYYIILTI